MIKFDEKEQEYICPFCGGFLDENNSDCVIIQVYKCWDCEKEMDSNGEEITDWEEYLIERE